MIILKCINFNNFQNYGLEPFDPLSFFIIFHSVTHRTYSYSGEICIISGDDESS